MSSTEQKRSRPPKPPVEVQKYSWRDNWATVQIPKSLHSIIKEIATKEVKPIWSIIEQAIGFYYAQSKNARVKEALSRVDKISWYVAKVGMSCGILKVEPTDLNYARLEKTVREIERRLKLSGDSSDLLLRVASIYLRKAKNGDKNEIRRLREDLNTALKMFIIDVIRSGEVEEELEEEELL